MKNSISKIVLSVLALVMVISVSYAFVAHSSTKSAPKLATTWYFTGSSSDVRDANFWTTTNPNDPDCGQGSDLPCDLSVDASTSAELQDYLTAHTVKEINDAASDHKPE